MTRSYSFLRHLAVAAFRPRAVRCSGVSDSPDFLPPSRPRSARYFRSAAGMRLAIASSLAGEHPAQQSVDMLSR